MSNRIILIGFSEDDIKYMKKNFSGHELSIGDTYFDVSLASEELVIVNINNYQFLRKTLPLIKRATFDSLIIPYFPEQDYDSLKESLKVGVRYCLDGLFRTEKNIKIIKEALQALSENKTTDLSSEITELIFHDEVTGLLNQRRLKLDLRDNVIEGKKNKSKFCLLFIDVDNFKEINDLYGHLVGSRFLAEIGSLIKAQTREYDLIYRYGGDEFVVLAGKTSCEHIYTIAKRIGQAIKENNFKARDGKDHNLTVSIGVAEFPTDADSLETVVDFADQMMYKSKKSGKAKIFHVGEIGD